MPLKYWCEAFQTSVYLINRLQTLVLKVSTAVTKLLGSTPDYLNLKTFGYACFPYIRPYQNQKFQFQSIKCIFLGYSNSYKGYKCVSSTGQIYISRHVVFNEKEFPFEHGFLNTKQSEITTVISSNAWLSIP